MGMSNASGTNSPGKSDNPTEPYIAGRVLPCGLLFHIAALMRDILHVIILPQLPRFGRPYKSVQ